MSTNSVSGVTLPWSSAPEAGDDLERRPRHVEALGRPVEQRRRRVLAEPRPLVLQVGGVEGRRRGRGDQGARLGVEHHDGALLPLQLLLRDLLHAGHQRELEVGALGPPPEQLVHPVLHAEVGGLAGELVVVLGLGPGAAVLHRVVADQLRRDGAAGVVAVVVARAALGAGDDGAVVAEDVAALDLHLLGDAALVLGAVLEPLRAHAHDPGEVHDQRHEEHHGDDEDLGHGPVHGATPSPPACGARGRCRRG